MAALTPPADSRRGPSPFRTVEPERRYAFYAAAASAVFFVAYWRPWTSGARLAFTGIGLAFCAVVAASAISRWRLAVAFTAFLLAVFGPWGYAYVLGVVPMGLCMWVSWRTSRAVRESVEGTRPPRPSKRRGAPEPKTPAKPPIVSKRVTPKKAPARRSSARARSAGKPGSRRDG